jgi:hypothetical protein
MQRYLLLDLAPAAKAGTVFSHQVRLGQTNAQDSAVDGYRLLRSIVRMRRKVGYFSPQWTS